MNRQTIKDSEAFSLFETKQAKGRVAYRLFALTVFLGICLIWFYRLTNIPEAGEQGRWCWIGMFIAEIGFGLYWIITQSVRWSISYYYPFKDRLSNSYEAEMLPGVDIFVCTADPTMEPPPLVINTVLSVMSFNYPAEKLSIYLSDDGGSEFTFYALVEASYFSKYWIPFCKKFNIQTRSPEACFNQQLQLQDATNSSQEWLNIKKQYEEMIRRIEAVMDKGSIPKEIKSQHKGFSEWNHNSIKHNHPSIVQILIDGRDRNTVDNDGCQLPTLVYMAREKKPDWPHNFKAGAMNSLMRVSSEISKGEIILNLDCDMYANDADAIKGALCFFMDEKRGRQIAYVQHPQKYNNITKNDLYANYNTVVHEIELPALGGYGAALYCGTGCFHRRESLCGKKYTGEYKGDYKMQTKRDYKRTVHDLEEASKIVCSCGYEKETPWGKEMGLVYGCPVEDIVTGLTIQCRGWKSVYYNPDRPAFLGVAPTALDIALIQYKRWSEGMFQIFLSKYCPFIYGHKKIKLAAQMGYCIYLLWAPCSLPTLYYVIIPSLCLLREISLFPKVSSIWFIPFAYVFLSKNLYGMAEAMVCGNTLKACWSLQRMWVIRRTSSYFFAFISTLMKQLGLSQTNFALTDKVVTEDVLKRYEEEIMEFGSPSVMVTTISALAMLNPFCLVGALLKMFLLDGANQLKGTENFFCQIVLCVLMVVGNAPVYQALFIRKDRGSIPSSVMFKSIVLASLAGIVALK